MAHFSIAHKHAEAPLQEQTWPARYCKDCHLTNMQEFHPGRHNGAVLDSSMLWHALWHASPGWLEQARVKRRTNWEARGEADVGRLAVRAHQLLPHEEDGRHICEAHIAVRLMRTSIIKHMRQVCSSMHLTADLAQPGMLPF